MTHTASRPLYKMGSIASILMVLLIPVQVVIFLMAPPPQTVEGFYALLSRNPLLGLVSLDLLYLANNVLMIVIYLALYTALRPVQPAWMHLALAFGLVGLAAYFASNPAFEMLTLSHQFASASTDTARLSALAAGQAMLATYTGSAFNAYYVLNALTLLIMAAVMRRSRFFSPATAWSGLIAGVLMLIPSTAGTIGLIFSLLSLIPWLVFSVLIARHFSQAVKQT